MRKDRSLITYGKHRNRVIVADEWSSEERKKHVFSTSSDMDASKQSNIFQTSGSENGSPQSDLSDVFAPRKKPNKGIETRKKKKNENKENVIPKELTSLRTSSWQVETHKSAWAVTSSSSESSIGSDAGVKPLSLRERKKVTYNDSENLKRQLRGTTAKRKRPVRTAAVQKNTILNFSDFDDYSLVISDNSVSKTANDTASIETSTPVAKRTRCQKTNIDKIEDTDISHIEVIESPTSDVCYTSLETPQSLRESPCNNFCSPSLVSSECSTNHKSNSLPRGIRNGQDSKLTPNVAVVELDRLSGSFIDRQLSSAGSSRHYNLRNKELDTFDQSASLFDTPSKQQENSVHILTHRLRNIGLRNKHEEIENVEESDEEEDYSNEEEYVTDKEESEEEEGDDSYEEEYDSNEDSDGEEIDRSVDKELSAIEEIEESENSDEQDYDEYEEDCSDLSGNSDKLDKISKVNLQRLSESLIHNHVSSRKSRNLRNLNLRQSGELTETDESVSTETSGRESEGSNCTLYMLADTHSSESRGSRGSRTSSDLFEESEEDILKNGNSTNMSKSDYHTAQSSRSSDEDEDKSCTDEGNEDQIELGKTDLQRSQTPRRLQLRNRSIEKLHNSFSEMLTPKRKKASIVPLSAQTRVLLLCNQSQPLSFQEALPGRMLSLCKKIGEGVYGEVFRSKNDEQSVAIKIIPIEGDFPVNDEPQKKFSEILPEIVIAKELSNLKHSNSENTSNFCEVKSVSIVEGEYPAQLIKQWDLFHKNKGSENDRPDNFPANQLFVLFEFADCGRDLESYEFDSMDQAKSVLTQVVFSLAVAEHSLQFEHRDLHWGNILIRPTNQEDISFKLMGRWFRIPTMGVMANVIDFTLSRLRKDGVTVYSDLSTDESLFQGEGDLQFDVYRKMKEENKNNWETFCPRSNVFWLHYVADKLVYGKKYPAQTSRHGRESLRMFRQFLSQILDYQSACDMAITADYLNS